METVNPVPWLRAGEGATPAEGGCIMQVIDWIHRGGWSDHPECVNPTIRELAICANDALNDHDRQELLNLAPRIMGTRTTVTRTVREHAEHERMAIRLAIHVARLLLPAYEKRMPDAKNLGLIIDRVERWLDSGSGHDAYRCHIYAAVAATVADDEAHPNQAKLYAAGVLALAATPRRPDDVAEAVNFMVSSLEAKARLRLLIRTLDEYDRLTGRTEVDELDYSGVCQVMAAR